MADATFCALEDQKTPNGYYNIGRMLSSIVRKKKVGICGTCMNARGLEDLTLLDGIYKSSMDELTDWILTSDKIITY
jgi:uncharacterized protein involved in oxidation of intracellular sulfur